jgi:hypothetical protein
MPISAGRRQAAVQRLQAETDEPEIAWTSPLALGNDQGKYSAGGSAAQKHSWKTA